MSRENVEIVRRIYEITGKALRDHAFPERDAREVFDPKVRLDLSRNVFNPGVYEGIHGLREMFENIWEVWEQFEMRPREFVESADEVAVVVEMRGRAREGVEVSRTIGARFRFEGNKVIEWVGGLDPNEALEAAGLSE